MSRSRSAAVTGPRRRAAAALLALLACFGALAADGDVLRLESWGPDQGLPQSTVMAMVNDDQGFLWVSTQDGIARFDGHRFQTWRGEGEVQAGPAARGLASGSIDSLAFDASSRRLWLGTNDAGVEVLHLPDWSRIRVNRASGLSHQQVTRIALDGEGGAWIGTGDGLDHVLPDAGKVTRLGGDAGIVGVERLSGNGSALALGRDCRLWRATAAAMEPLATLPGTPGDCIALQAGPEGAWAASEHAGVFLLDARSGRVLRRLPLAALASGAQPVTTLLRRRDGSLLVGLRGGRIVRIAGPASEPELLALDRRLESAVTALHEDPAGSLWIGSYTSGLHYARPLSPVVRAGSAEAGAPGGWPRGSMRAIWRSGGHTLLGTDSGMFERRAGESLWREVAGFEGQSVRCISGSADGGGWWVGSHDGLWHWSGHAPPRPVPGLPDARIDALLVDGDDGWVGTRGGLARLRGGRIVDDPALAPLLASHVTALVGTGSHLWIATNADGLWRLDPGGSPEPVSPDALHRSLWSLAVDDDASLWVGSWARGAYRVDRATGATDNYSQREGLGSNVIYSLLPDAMGRIWASTNSGISVLDPANDSIQTLGPRDGLVNHEYNSGSALRDAEGLMYFGGTRGIDVLDPAGLPRHSPPARPVLTTLRVAPLDANGEGPRETDIVYLDQVRLAHADRMVTVQMTAIDFGAPDAAQLRYRVLGLHEDWVQPHSPRAEFSVTDLPSGRYVLEVEAAGRDGRYGPARRFGIEMAPPWWRHPVAYAGYGLLLLMLLALVARRIDAAVRRERRQVELLERTVAERTAQLQLANQRLSRTNAELSIATRRDPLTRISNRRDLQAWLGREAAELRRRSEAADGSGSRLVFLMIDIDDFKRVNDAHGHQAGDEVLVHFADRLRLLSRDDDLLVRWGGEEFLLISRFTRLEDAAALAERIRAAIATQPIRIGRGLSLDLTCSIGFAPWPFALEWPGLGDWGACVGLADRCLYAVKRSRKNGWLGVVPGDDPDPEAIRELLAGSHPDAIAPGTARVLQSDDQASGFL